MIVVAILENPGSLAPDKTTWLDTAPSCLAPDFPVDYSSGCGFGEAAAFPRDPGILAAGSAGQAGNLLAVQSAGFVDSAVHCTELRQWVCTAELLR